MFYGWWDPRYVPLLAGLAVATWAIGRLYVRHPRALLLVLGLALNLGALAWFKYADFLGANLAWLAGAPWTPLHIVLPLGISFFVFQKVSYLIDVRRGDRHEYGLLDFCLFVSFFPQLIAGPLVRHNEIIPQFRADPRGPAMWENLSRGLVLFLIGMAKKLWIADTLAPGSMRCSPARAPACRAPGQPGRRPAAMRCRSISTSPATPTWRSGWRGCSACACR